MPNPTNTARPATRATARRRATRAIGNDGREFKAGDTVRCVLANPGENIQANQTYVVGAIMKGVRLNANDLLSGDECDAGTSLVAAAAKLTPDGFVAVKFSEPKVILGGGKAPYLWDSSRFVKA